MRVRPSVLVVVGAGALVAASVVSPVAAPAQPAGPSFATWTTPSSGTLDGVAVSANDGYLDTYDYSTADYVPPATAGYSTPAYVSDEQLDVVLAEPMIDVALYVKYLRGSEVDGPAAFALGSGGGCTWSIQSGLAGATLTGSTLDVSGLDFLDGVLVCTGTTASVSMAPVGPLVGGFQAYTVASFGGVAPTTTTTSTTTTIQPSTTSTTTVSDGDVAGTGAGAVVTPTFTG